MVTSKKVLGNLIWQFLEKFGNKIISLILSIILARLLMPSDYGVLAIVLAFVNLCDVFIIYGLGNALVQKKDADEIDYCTVFYTQLFISVAVYAVLYIVAPYIAQFYGAGYEVVSPAIRVLGLNVIVAAMGNVNNALIVKRMRFRLSFFSSLTGTIVSATVGIVMAICDMGVWALVAQSLGAAAINTAVQWMIVRWRPGLKFSFSRLKLLYSYGWKLLCVGLLENLYLELRSLIIGKAYSSEDLAHYNRGEQFPKIISVNINSSIKTVLFSAISSEQDDISVIKKMTKRAIKTSSFMLFPFLIWLFVASDHIVPLLLTEKWNACVPYLRVFCLVYMFMPLQTTNMQIYKGVGRTGLSLWLEITKKAIGILGLIISMQYGPLAIAIAFAITTIINAIVSALPNKKIIDYGIIEQFGDMLPGVAVSILFAVPIYFIGLAQLGDLIIILLQIVVALLIYVGVSELFKIESYIYIKRLLLSFIKKKS